MGIVAILLAVVVLLAIIAAYNMLVRRRNAVDNAFAGMDAYLTMRYDLIPNLVAVVKEYARHECEILPNVTELRSQAQTDRFGTNERVQLDNRINPLVARVMALSERYPQLKASDSFQKLGRALNEVEERVAASRRAFNAAATDLNNAIELFPINLVASAFGFKRSALFSGEESAHAGASIAHSMSS